MGKDCKQGWINSYPSRVRVGRGKDGEGHYGIWAGAVSPKVKSLKNAQKVIVAKALDGQRFPLPLSECMRV